jgi:ABC-type transport system involved in multi-copper enzyme maturation permease subunit
MVLLALIIVGISTLIFSVVRSWAEALVVAVVSAAVLVGLLLVVPLLVARRNARP